MDLEKAYKIADQDSPHPQAAKQALSAMRDEIERLRARSPALDGTDKVRPIRYLDSVPDMLRIWADDFLDGGTPVPDTALLIGVYPDDRQPVLFHTGTNPQKLRAIGALHYATQLILEAMRDE